MIDLSPSGIRAGMEAHERRIVYCRVGGHRPTPEPATVIATPHWLVETACDEHRDLLRACSGKSCISGSHDPGELVEIPRGSTVAEVRRLLG